MFSIVYEIGIRNGIDKMILNIILLNCLLCCDLYTVYTIEIQFICRSESLNETKNE